jgi:glycosyltransferase involved in cell wall biosynthesis
MSVSIIILTYNEELNLPECLKAAKLLSDDLIIIDSYSKDKTPEIAKEYECNFILNKFVNQGIQFNWALDNVQFKYDWILRLDADEVLTNNNIKEISEQLKNPISEAYEFNKRIIWMGRRLRFGGIYPMKVTRLFKRGSSRYEERTEENLIVNGKVKNLKYDLEENNKKNDMYNFTIKHLHTGAGECEEYFNKINFSNSIKPSLIGTKSQKNRWLKLNFYNRSPIFLRGFLYFIYRYIFLLGFLDGIPGLTFHFLQGFWYRFLIDCLIYEKKNK